MSDEEFDKLPTTLPGWIEGTRIALEYNNGPLREFELARSHRQVKLLPLDEPTDQLGVPIDDKVAIADNTDYVQRDGKFYPGSMLSAVFYQKRKYRKRQYRIPGICRDVALAQLDEGIIFENQFFSDLKTTPKVLLQSDQCTWKAEFLVESFAKGCEKLLAGGEYVTSKTRSQRAQAQPIISRGMPIPDLILDYVTCRQKIFISHGQEILRPRLPDSNYGSVLVRFKSNTEIVLDRGEICAMTHWKNIQSRFATARELLIFVDAFDSLIEDGWEVDQFEGDYADGKTRGSSHHC
ncbi:hypothetical protein ABW21_db0206691 [Orbilia brochopaga]|nr:hypothetical protein ABW21_db0206691 [Drechslerella brochopaga]